MEGWDERVACWDGVSLATKGKAAKISPGGLRSQLILQTPTGSGAAAVDLRGQTTAALPKSVSLSGGIWNKHIFRCACRNRHH